MESALFISFWSEYGEKSLVDRRKYFNSLTPAQRDNLVLSFYQGGWDKFFAQVFIDRLLDQIKNTYQIDLIELRICAIKNNKSFFVLRRIWDSIEDLFSDWHDVYNTDIIFGGLKVCPIGKRYYRIRAKQPNQWR